MNAVYLTNSLDKVKSDPMKFLIYTGLLFIKLQAFPNANLLVYLAIAIALDFVTGVSKSIVKKQARTSTGFRKTIIKMLQYMGVMAVGILLQNAARENNWGGEGILSYFNDGLIVFMLYIEATSVFENLYACDQKSVISRMIISPIYKLLTAQVNKGFFSTPPMPTDPKPDTQPGNANP
jgi:hypothetical protein